MKRMMHVAIRGVNRVGLVGFGSNGSGPSRVETKNNIPEPDPI